MTTTQEDADDLAQELYGINRRRGRYNCFDGMCGALDCETCYPYSSQFHPQGEFEEDDENGCE